jgi:antitoxin CcdA
MKSIYDTNAPKKPTNLSINSDLLKKTKSLNINLSATLEQALRDILAKKVTAQWRVENKNAIAAYNKFIEENGLFSDEYRVF